MICKATLVDVKNDYEKRVKKYIETISNKSFEEVTDPQAPLHKANGIKFLNVKRNGTQAGFSIDINRDGLNQLIVQETQRIQREDFDENIDPDNPPLPPEGMLPGTPIKNDFNYSETLSHRKLLKDSVDRKIQLLQNEELREETSRAQLEQIANLKELSVSLFKEIQFLEKNDGDINAFIDNLKVDIENMATLLKNPTVENLEFVRKYKNMIAHFVKDGEGGFLNSSFADLKKNRPSVYANIIEAQKGIGEVDKDFDDKVKLKIIEKIEHFLKQKEENSTASEDFINTEAQRLYKEQFEEKDKLNYILKFYTRMDEQEEQGNALASVIKKSYDDAVRNNGKKGVEDKLLAKEKSITARLIATGNVISSFFSKKATWDVFKTDNKGESRLINPFTVSWQKFKKSNARRQKNISRIFYNFSLENSDAQTNTIDKHYEELNKEVNFVDVRKLPELLGNPDFAEFQSNFTSNLRAPQEYKEELIENMGQREYDKLVKEAEDNINSFMIEKDVKLNQLLEEYKVTDVKDLQQAMFNAGAESVWNFYLQNFYTKSPFVFAENHFDQGTGNKIAKVFFIENKQYLNYDARANLEYSTFTPKSKYKEQKFEDKIKNDPTLLEAWELMDELVEYSNLNGTDYNAESDLETDLGHERKETHLLLDILGLLSPNVLRNLKRINSKFTKTISGVGVKSETGDDRTVVGQRTSTESKIQNQFKKLITIDGLKQKDMTEEEIQEYRERALELINQEADNENLLHNIVTSSQMTGAFKAKKEVETFINFLANQLRGIESRGGFSSIVDYFINRNLYGIQNRGKTPKGVLRNQFGSKVKHYPIEHQKIREELKSGIKAVKKLLEKDPGNEELEKQLADLEVMMEAGVLYVNGRDVTEAILFKIKAFTAFAINGSAQVTNMAIASANAYEVDGREGYWKAGVYTKAMSFARKYKNVGAVTTKKMAEQRKIMDLFLKSANLVQNSANEIYKEQTSRYGSALKQIIKNPTNFVGEVEKTIQKPQLLALLSSVEITDNAGNIVSIFDADKGTFPAFEIQDGVLVLKKEYDTENNRDTFLSFNSQEAANIFGESGKLPKAIAFINGDYRDSTAYLAEKYLVTAMTLMFKRWAIATIYKKAGIYKRLAEKDQNVATIGYQMLKAGIFATSVGSAGLIAGVSMPMLVAAGIGFYAVKHRQKFLKTIKEDTEVLDNIYKNTKEAELGLQVEKFMKGGATVATLAISTAAQALLNIPSRFIGRDVIDSDRLKSIVYVDKKKYSTKEVEEIRDDLYFLQTSTALVIRNMIYGVMLHSLYSILDPGFDDDEEKEAYKKLIKESKGVSVETISEYPALSTYYALNNMLSSFAEDMSLTENWKGLQRMGQVGSMEDAYNVLEAVVQGGEYQRGKNAGRNKGAVLAEKYVIPSAVSFLGFGKKTERDYNATGLVDTFFKTNFETLSEIQEIHKKDAKLVKEKELKEELEYDLSEDKADWLSNKLTQFSKDEYPSLKIEDFYKDGTLTPEGQIKIENYRSKIPEDLLKKLDGE
jgi:hypothetical protein